MMFNDRYGLTAAVLQGRKTMTRRIVPDRYVPLIEVGMRKTALVRAQRHGDAFSEGEIVAVAQSYKEVNDYSYVLDFKHTPGWSNKMFVRAGLMPHRIRITGINVERLQDIGVEDVYREGFSKEAVDCGWGNAAWRWEAMLAYVDNLGRCRQIRSEVPREAFAILIDKVAGYGTWERNPWVFAYSFELLM